MGENSRFSNYHGATMPIIRVLGYQSGRGENPEIPLEVPKIP
jgi:hypothetical protein